MGALIVFERSTKLGEIIDTGTVVDAEPTAEIVGNVFFNKAPLHDGAMIVRDGKIFAAGCILPLTQNASISSELGDASPCSNWTDGNFRRAGCGGIGGNGEYIGGAKRFADKEFYKGYLAGYFGTRADYR